MSAVERKKKPAPEVQVLSADRLEVVNNDINMPYKPVLQVNRGHANNGANGITKGINGLRILRSAQG